LAIAGLHDNQETEIKHLDTRQTQAIQICQRKLERKVLGINLKDRMWNEELRRRSGMEDAAKAARRLKWRWGGHVARMDQER
jgi:hypothetical protein